LWQRLRRVQYKRRAVDRGSPADFAIVWYIAGAVLLLELLAANRYGFGDEMYPRACGEHMA